MSVYLFNITMSPEECELYYRGLIRYLQVITDNGLKVRLHFRHFQPFISQLGLSGRFRLQLGPDNNLVKLEKIN